MSSVCSWRRMSIASSWVTIPTSMSEASRIGTAKRSYLSTFRATASWSSSTRAEITSRCMISVDPGARPGQDQALERDDAEELVAGVDDVAVVDRLAVGGLAAEPVERLADGQARRQGGVVGRHDRAGRPRLVAGQAADVVALGLGQVPEDLVGPVLVEPVDQVGPVVVRHQVEQARRLDRRHRLDEADLPLAADVAHHLGPGPVGQQPQRRVAPRLAEVLDDLGHVRRVVVGQELAQGRSLARADQLAGGRAPAAGFGASGRSLLSLESSGRSRS